MTTADDILAARQAGAELRAVGGELQVLHGDRLPADLRDRLRANRAEVLAALSEPVPTFAPTIAWCSPEPQHRRVVQALAERDAERLAQPGRFCGNFMRADAEHLARRNPGLRIGPPRAAGGKTCKELQAASMVGVYVNETRETEP